MIILKHHLTFLYFFLSAGIGRTGTFIALDYLMDQAMEEQHVGVPACVNKLREHRVNMVQNVVTTESIWCRMW